MRKLRKQRRVLLLQRLPTRLLFAGRRGRRRVVLLDVTVNIPCSLDPSLHWLLMDGKFRNGRSWTDQEISQADANATEGKRTQLSLSLSFSSFSREYLISGPQEREREKRRTPSLPRTMRVADRRIVSKPRRVLASLARHQAQPL